MHFKSTLRTCLAITALTALMACDTAEERAEKHFQSATELLEAGDFERAVVEFRNVFKLDPTHRRARTAFAEEQAERGASKSAITQYRIIAEAYPDDLNARVALATYAVEVSDWESARTYGEEAKNLDPDNPQVQTVQTALAYFDAVRDLDNSARRVSAEKAVALREAVPDSIVLSNIIIDNALRENDTETALSELDAALEQDPQNRDLHMMRLAILNQKGDLVAMEEHLLSMIEQFPEDSNSKSLLVQYYVTQGKLDKAESFLRGLFSPTDEDPANYLAFIQFVKKQRGDEAALKELDNAIAVSPTPEVFEVVKAGLDFEQGRRDQAISAVEEQIGKVENPEHLRAFKVTLAQMLVQTGNEVGARRYVEEVLKEDSENIQAIKMSASWMIRDDKAEEAIVALRSALEIEPEDTQIMALIADAHSRNGNRELARDMFALAAETSNFAPTETLRYANVLLEEEQYRASEEILVRALRLAPQDLGLLSALGRVYVRESDWPRALQVESSLRKLDTSQGTERADALKLSVLQNQEKTNEAVSFLENLIEENGQSLGATVAILQTHLRSGDTGKALSVVDQALEAEPESQPLLFLKSAALAADGQFEEAIAGYKSLLEANPNNEQIWMETIKAQRVAGKIDDADATLEEGLKQLPDAPNLLWAKASQLEQAGEIDATIEIYERIYAKSSESPIVANNLASLLATYKDDEESLKRAYNIARRLRGLEVPAFQDTYGWIAYRRGLYDEALQHLEPGAEGLPNDPLAQFHLGMTYAALDRPDEAIEALNRAISLAPNDERPQFAEAQKKIEELESAK